MSNKNEYISIWLVVAIIVILYFIYKKYKEKRSTDTDDALLEKHINDSIQKFIKSKVDCTKFQSSIREYMVKLHASTNGVYFKTMNCHEIKNKFTESFNKKKIAINSAKLDSKTLTYYLDIINSLNKILHRMIDMSCHDNRVDPIKLYELIEKKINKVCNNIGYKGNEY